MAKIILFGAYGQAADIALFYIENDTDHEIVAFTMDHDFIDKTSWKNRPVIPFEKLENHFAPSEYKMFIPILNKKVNKIRKERYLSAKKKGYKFITYISPKATYYNTPVGENCFIMEDNTIQPHTRIGNNVIMWSGNHLGHHSIISDHCFIASHVVISGSVTIGESTFIGVNATLRDNINIGNEVVIGMSSVILKDVPDRAVISPGPTPTLSITSDKIKEI